MGIITIRMPLEGFINQIGSGASPYFVSFCFRVAYQIHASMCNNYVLFRSWGEIAYRPYPALVPPIIFTSTSTFPFSFFLPSNLIPSSSLSPAPPPHSLFPAFVRCYRYPQVLPLSAIANLNINASSIQCE